MIRNIKFQEIVSELAFTSEVFLLSTHFSYHP